MPQLKTSLLELTSCHVWLLGMIFKSIEKSLHYSMDVVWGMWPSQAKPVLSRTVTISMTCVASKIFSNWLIRSFVIPPSSLAFDPKKLMDRLNLNYFMSISSVFKGSAISISFTSATGFFVTFPSWCPFIRASSDPGKPFLWSGPLRQLSQEIKDFKQKVKSLM